MEKFFNLLTAHGLCLIHENLGEVIESSKMDELYRQPRLGEDTEEYLEFILEWHTLKVADKAKFNQSFGLSDDWLEMSTAFYESVCLLPDEEGSLLFGNYQTDESGFESRVKKDIKKNEQWYCEKYPEYKLKSVFNEGEAQKDVIEDQVNLRIGFMDEQPSEEVREDLFNSLLEVMEEWSSLKNK